MSDDRTAGSVPSAHHSCAERATPRADVLSVAGELDVSTTSRISAMLEQIEPASTVIDMRGVTFIDLGGIRPFLLAARSAPGGPMRILASTPVRRLLELAELTDAFDVEIH